MEKILTIDGRQVPFKSTGAFLLKYKAQFGRDAMQDIFKLQKAMEDKVDVETGEKSAKITNLEALDLEVFYNLVWTLAKTADPEIAPPMEWLDGFGEFPLLEIIPEITGMIFSCLSTTVQSKKK
ncbi:Hypothetical protein DPCES_5351 [Desulfitobacterium hafniense]|uniref:Prophage pi2 protein 40 n=1 Tax=Desulfitobacterium hafniense TaxID=49338 RepID=A0A098AU85_DESHA|nr:hypothetical protein [Desulfitobacterium hafniense]CDV96349.1 Hypothetical protein DPCES_5351 [Desulfitobacterium hafniense]